MRNMSSNLTKNASSDCSYVMIFIYYTNSLCMDDEIPLIQSQFPGERADFRLLSQSPFFSGQIDPLLKGSWSSRCYLNFLFFDE